MKNKKKELTLQSIREAVANLKRAQELKKEVKFYKMPIKNWELFEKLKEQGKIYEVHPGLWEIK